MTQILRLTQSPPSQGKYNVRIELLREGEFTQTIDVSFEFNLSLQDQERFRWYFEDYLQYPQDPVPSIAGQVEELLMKIGVELFDKIFKSNFDAHKIWSYALPQLNNTRIEIATDVQEATTIPWELICNPDTLQPLALSAASFMRTFSQAAVPPKFKNTPKGPIRILLAICRPDADNDVPFRSVASRVISGLCKEGGSRFQLDLLRPPTFDQLGRVLRKAKDEGKPYHVFHFDGHGTYADLGGSGGFGGVNRNTFASQRPGQCGYLLFENPRQEENMELVVDLRPEDGGARPITFDLVPRAEIEEQTGTFTLGIGPDFKFSSVNVTLAKAETTINLRRVFPVITADGIGESTARWVFASRPAHPLVGSQIVYAIVQLPPGVEAARVSLFLNAEMTTGFGPIKGLLPKIQECCYSIFGMFVWMWQLHQPIHLYATGLHLALPNFPMQKILPSFFPDHLI